MKTCSEASKPAYSCVSSGNATNLFFSRPPQIAIS